MSSARMSDWIADQAILDLCVCIGATFDNVNLTSASFRGANLQGSRFTKTICASALFQVSKKKKLRCACSQNAHCRAHAQVCFCRFS
jgi:uncharacterized protein YjbI with pentapeptide repeats